jgi:hypothetical protein
MRNVRHILHNAAREVTLTFWLETRAINSGTLSKYEMSHYILPHYGDSYTRTFI